MATPTTSSHRRRPPQLDLADDKTKHDIILQIVLPIAPLAVSGEMLQTLRLSDSIRQKQSSLIAAAAAAASALSASSAATSATSVSMPSADDAAVLSGVESGDDSYEGTAPQHAESILPPLDDGKSPRQPSSSLELALSSDHEQDAGRDHFRLGMTSKRIRRDKAPKPLRLALPMSGLPMICSAPLRTFGHPGLHPSRAVSRRLYPPQYMPMTAVVATPMPRMVRVRDVRDFRDARGSKPRKAIKGPVRDVFVDEQVRPAPISSQPLSAQKEHFSLSDDEREDDDQRLQSLEGAITFNEEAHYRFRIFDDKAAKEKFMKICETTWDKYVQSSQGALRR